jgi:hypothetical protein
MTKEYKIVSGESEPAVERKIASHQKKDFVVVENTFRVATFPGGALYIALLMVKET